MGGNEKELLKGGTNNHSSDGLSQMETGTHLVPTGFPGKKKVSYFRDKYAGKVCEPLELDLNHPFLGELKKSFDGHVVSQNKAKEYLAQAMLDSILKIGDSKGPLGVFFFHGPTGVGKTEMVKALAETMFGDNSAFINIGCEHLMESHKGSTLFGSPPGYIESDKTPRLNNKAVQLHYDVAKQMKKLNNMISSLPRFNLILFDEIEKAHGDVIQQFLGLIDEGKVTTSKGEVVNFQNSIIIFTSNVGQKELGGLKDKNSMGFTKGEFTSKDKEKIFQKALKDKFSPEFIGRIHNFIEFEQLTEDDCKTILDIQINKLNEYLLKYFTESHIQFEISPSLYEMLIKKGFSREKGARELVRTFNTSVKRYLTRLLHSDGFKKYYDYEGEVLIGIDRDDTDVLTYEIILGGEKNTFKEVLLLEDKSEKSNMTLERLNEIYATMSAYVELTYINLDGDIDMKDELKIYADKLKGFGLSQTDISSLKNRAYLEGLRDLVFLQDFEGIGLGDDVKDLYHPYDARTIIKIVERKMASIYGEGHISKRKFIIDAAKGVIEIITKLFKVAELSGSQTNQLLFYVRKNLVEKYGINHDY